MKKRKIFLPGRTCALWCQSPKNMLAEALILPFLTLFRKAISDYSERLTNLIGLRVINFPLTPHGGSGKQLQELWLISLELSECRCIWLKPSPNTNKLFADSLKISGVNLCRRKLPQRWGWKLKKFIILKKLTRIL